MAEDRNVYKIHDNGSLGEVQGWRLKRREVFL